MKCLDILIQTGTRIREVSEWIEHDQGVDTESVIHMESNGVSMSPFEPLNAIYMH